MKLTDSFFKQIARLNTIGQMSQFHYRASDVASLISAFNAKGHETNLLNFHVHYLDEESFRCALREIFVHCDYLFEVSNDAPVILDCGANIGLAALYFKRLYPKARISCFEPDPTTAAILQKNIQQNNLSDVTTHNLMLSNENGERSFYVATNVPGSLRMSNSPDRLSEHSEIRVKTGKLSDYVDGPIDLLKMDIEGAESEVITDLISSGKISQIKQMVIEYHHKIEGQASRMSKFLALLEEEGFEYQLSGHCRPVTKQNTFQDILIGAYRSSPN
jgi:FkbM family methyltransferase